MSDAHEITPDEREAYAILRDRDGNKVVAKSQREVDEATKEGAIPDGATWRPRSNRQTARRSGRHANQGAARARRRRAHDVEHGPLTPDVDDNGRPLRTPPILSDEQIQARAAGHRRNVERKPWRRPRRDDAS